MSYVVGNATNPAIHTDYTVGVYYYPWYNTQGSREPFHAQAGSYIRRELNPPQFPTLGEYDDSNHETINQHVEWSTYAGINLWVTSYFGPEQDLSIRDVILQNQQFIDSDIKVAIHYESYGRMKPTKDEFDDEHLLDLSNVHTDMVHICTHYFGNPKYLRLNNRPVIVLYVSRSLNSRKHFEILDDVVGIMRQTANDYGYPEITIIGDQIWRDAPIDTNSYSPFQLLDAVTNYDNRNQIPFTIPYAKLNDTNTYYQKQLNWHNAALQANCNFIPSITPGFNKRGQRQVNKRAHSRRLQSSFKPNGSFFETLLMNALSMTDSATGNIFMINSWNEFHEDTQIEPVGNFTVTDSDGEEIGCTNQPLELTEGVKYCAYDHLFLNIIRENVLLASESTCWGGGSNSQIVLNGDFEGEVYSTSRSTYTRTNKDIHPWQSNSYNGGGVSLHLETEDELTLDYDGTYSTRTNTYLKVSNRQHELDGLYQVHGQSTCMFQVGQQWNIEARIKLTGGNTCSPIIQNDCPSLHWVYMPAGATSDDEKVTILSFDDDYTWKANEWNTLSKNIIITSDMVPPTREEILMSLLPLSGTVTATYKSTLVGGSNNNAFSDFLLDDVTFTRVYPSSKMTSSAEEMPSTPQPTSSPPTSPPPTIPFHCTDDPVGWHDLGGEIYDCSFYAEGTWCETDGDNIAYINFGKTANEACCACGGGRNIVNPSSTSTTPFPTPSPSTGSLVPSDCVDNPDYIDVQGYTCDGGWGCCDCNEAYEKWGYTMDQQDEIIRNCPLSCNHCNR